MDENVKTVSAIRKEIEVIYETIETINHFEGPFKKEYIVEIIQNKLNLEMDVFNLVEEVIEFLIMSHHVKFYDGMYYLEDRYKY